MLLSPSNKKKEADATPPFLETKQKMSVSRFEEFPGRRGNNVFVRSEKLKSEEGKLDALASSFLRHGGHFLGAEASFFVKL